MCYPSLEQAKQIAADEAYKIIPISMELFADRKTPVEVLRILKHVSRHCYMLESAEDNKRWGRYTFLGYNPILELTCHNHEVRMTSGMTQTFQAEHPGAFIRDILQQYRSPKLAGLPPFTGGLVGYFSYDYIKYSEPTLEVTDEGGEDFKDMDVMLFDKVIAFDNYRQKIVLIVNAKTDNLETNYHNAEAELRDMASLLADGEPEKNKPLKLTSEFRSLFSRDAYCEMVEKAKNYIREGDIFQVVLSNRFEADMEGSLLDTYRVLRTTNPSPYMFYFSSDDVEIAGASPETLVKLENRDLYTFPLAGTRPRGADEEEDLRLEKELLADEKELAEHNMLVDLGRNDIGKISEIGTVNVDKYMSIERFSHVMHIGSTVSGQIAEGKDALDAIDSILPAGTLSGAPKIRACEIIHELEHNKRGIYGGAIGYIDFTGNLDTCIAIRLAFAKNGKVFVRSGAGIVADSVPENEYQECVNKAKAVMQALEIAKEGIR
ncbi:anthranilate synthase component I [Hespellia stercorisuis]|uniref:Anthranilate synthase component 1 n=1 Tax=Hespellia stercorisuis DSM 15480 TaxID=1121950 RepID=A0A1M6RC22_9FIRM|nr:anthranilate synthase component I [Hespellia stercorisuis]SHK29887.1 anthranilate synthase component 1 [Hespellia stercorisuis DSM 15480]